MQGGHYNPCAAAPPQLLYARWDDSLVWIELAFDVRTDRGENATRGQRRNRPLSYDCSDYIHDAVMFGESTEAYGFPSGCFWASDRTLRIYLGLGSLVSPGDTVRIRDGVVLTRSCAGTHDLGPAAMSQSAPITGPATRPLVQAVISGPDLIGVCTPIVLRGDASLGSGPQRLRYQWALYSFRAASPNETVHATDVKMILQAIVQAGDSPVLRVLGAPTLTNGVNYTFRLTVANMFGDSHSAFVNVTKSPWEVPYPEVSSGAAADVILRGPDGSVELTASFEPYQYGIEPGCVRRAAISTPVFTWFAPDHNIPDIPSPAGVVATQLTVSKEKLTQKGLGCYRILLFAQHKWMINTPYGATRELRVCIEAVSPEPSITGCNRMVHGSLLGGETKVATLDASQSSDPQSGGSVILEWQCSIPVLDPDNQLQDYDCPYFDTGNKHNPLLKIESKELQEQALYEFNLRVLSPVSGLSSTESCLLYAVPEDVLMADVEVSIDLFRPLGINFTVLSVQEQNGGAVFDPDKLTYVSWDCYNGYFESCGLSSDVVVFGIGDEGHHDEKPRDKLQLGVNQSRIFSGVDVKIGAEIVYGGVKAFGWVHLKLQPAPTFGYCNASRWSFGFGMPLQGTNTYVYEIVCDSWWDPAGSDLLYRFGVLRAGQTQWEWMTETRRNRALVALERPPKGHNAHHVLQAVVSSENSGRQVSIGVPITIFDDLTTRTPSTAPTLSKSPTAAPTQWCRVAPQLVQTIIEDDLLSIRVTFDKDVDTSQLRGPGGAGKCPIEWTSRCVWDSNKTCKMYFDRIDTVRVGDKMELRPNTIAAFGCIDKADKVFSSSWSLLEAPQSAPPIQAAIIGSSVYGPCNPEILLFADDSVAASGRDLDYRWSLIDIQGQPVDPRVPFGAAEQHALVQAISREDGRRLQMGGIPEGIVIRVVLTVIDWLGRSDTSEPHTVSRSAQPVPFVTVPVSKHIVKLTEDIILEARYRGQQVRDDKACQRPDLNKIEFRWTVWREGSNVPIEIQSNKELRIRRNALSPGITYVARLEARYGGSSVKSASNVSLVVEEEDYELVIDNCNRVFQAGDDSIKYVVNASQSVDPNDPSNQLMMEWTCKKDYKDDNVPDEDCSDDILGPAAMRHGNTVEIQSKDILVTDDDTFSYTLVVRASSHGSNQVKERGCVIEGGNYSVIQTLYLSDPDYDYASLDPIATVEPHLKVETGYIVDRFWWGCVFESGIDCNLDFNQTGDDDRIFAAIGNVPSLATESLMINMSALANGVRHIVYIVVIQRPIANNQPWKSAFAFTFVEPKSGPSSGVCEMDPAQGTADITDFEIRCFNWIDGGHDSARLRYTITSSTRGADNHQEEAISSGYSSSVVTTLSAQGIQDISVSIDNGNSRAAKETLSVLVIARTDAPSSQSPISLSPTAAPSTRTPSTPGTCFAPRIESVSFSNDAQSLIVDFTKYTNRGSSAVDEERTVCSRFFAGDTIFSFGTGAVCAWASSKRLLVRLGSRPTVTVGSQVRLQDGVIASRSCPENSIELSINGVAAVSRALLPIRPPRVRAILSYPGRVGMCSALYVSACNSLGSAGRAFQYQWSLGKHSTNNNSYVVGFVTQQIAQNTGPVLNLDGYDLPAGYYQVVLRLTNWLGHSAEASANVSVSRTHRAPHVVIDVGDYVSVDPDGIVILTSSHISTLRNSSQLPGSCAQVQSVSAIRYQWAQIEGPQLRAQQGVAPITYVRSYLQLPPFAMHPGLLYVFRLTAWFVGADFSKQNSTVEVTVATNRIRPTADIQSCNRVLRKTDSQSTYSISALTSTMYTVPPPADSAAPVLLQARQLNYTWRCRVLVDDPDDGSEISDSCYPLLVGENAAASAHPGELRVSSDHLNMTGVSVPAPYELTVSVRGPYGGDYSQNSQTEATNATCLLLVDSESQLQLQVDTSVSFAASQVSLRVSPLSGEGAAMDTARVQWGCFKGSHGDSCGLDLASIGNTHYFTQGLDALFAGVVYRFYARVVAFDENGNVKSGLAIANVELGSRPGGNGHCFADPLHGISYSTVFRLACVGFASDKDDQRLSIAFEKSTGDSKQDGFVAAESDSFTVLCGSSYAAVCSAQLAGGSEPGVKNQTFRATIKTRAGRLRRVLFYALVETHAISEEEADVIVDAETTNAQDAAEQGDLSSMAQAIDKVVTTLNSSSSNSTRSVAVTNSLVEAIETGVDKSETTTESIVQIASLLSLVIQNPDNIEEDTAIVVLKRIRNMSASVRTADSVEYTPDYGVQCIRALSQAIVVVQRENSKTKNTSVLSAAVGNEALFDVGLAMANSAPGAGSRVDVVAGSLSVSSAKFAAVDNALNISHSGGSDKINVPTSGLKDSGGMPVAQRPGEFLTTVVILGPSVWPTSVESHAVTQTLTLRVYFGGKELNVSGLAETESISMSFGSNNVSTASSAAVKEPICQYYDETIAGWSRRGCKVVTVSGAAFVCSCSHLTSFQGAEVTKTNTISAQDVRNLTLENLGRNPFTLFALVFVFSVYFLFLGYAHRRTARKYASAKQNDNDIEYDEFIIQWYHQFIANDLESEMDRLEESEDLQRNKEGVFVSVRGTETTCEYGRVQGSAESDEVNSKSLTGAALDSKAVPGERSSSMTSLNIGDYDLRSHARSRSWTRVRGRSRSRSRTRTRNITDSSAGSVISDDPAIDLVGLCFRVDQRRSGRDLNHIDTARKGKQDRQTAVSVSDLEPPAGATTASTATQTPDPDSSVKSSSSHSNGRCGRVVQAVWAFIATVAVCGCFCRHPEGYERKRLKEKTEILLRLKLTLLDQHESFSEKSDKKSMKKLRRKRKHLQRNLRKTTGARRESVWKEETRDAVSDGAMATPRRRLRNRKACKLVSRVWRKKMTKAHMWVSVLAHHRNDTYTSRWRANILLQSLLLILCANGLFYGIQRAKATVVVTGVTSALVVSVINILFVFAAKKIGTYKWEVRMCELRQRLCYRVGANPMHGAATEALVDAKHAKVSSGAGPSSMIEMTPLRRSKSDAKDRKSWSATGSVESGSSLGTPGALPGPKSPAALTDSDKPPPPRVLEAAFRRKRRPSSGSGSESTMALGWSSIPDSEDIHHAEQTSNPNAAHMVEDKQGRAQIRQLVRRQKCISWSSSLLFLAIILGTSFSILVLGVKFDLESDTEGRALHVHQSTSFKWLLSCIVSETFRSVFTLPLVCLVKALGVYFALVGLPMLMQRRVVNWFISDDDLDDLKAYDVFERVNEGYGLNAEGVARLHRQIQLMGDAPLLPIDIVSPPDVTTAVPVLVGPPGLIKVSRQGLSSDEYEDAPPKVPPPEWFARDGDAPSKPPALVDGRGLRQAGRSMLVRSSRNRSSSGVQAMLLRATGATSRRSLGYV